MRNQVPATDPLPVMAAGATPCVRPARGSGTYFAGALVLLIAIAACDAGSPTNAEDVEQVAGSYSLVSVGTRCDVHDGTRVVEGGVFTPQTVGGSMTLTPDGRATHEFEIAGTCRMPSGAEFRIDNTYADNTGQYEVSGRTVRMTHHGIDCVGTVRDGVLTVQTGTLFPDVRFTYELHRTAGA